MVEIFLVDNRLIRTNVSNLLVCAIYIYLKAFPVSSPSAKICYLL